MEEVSGAFSYRIDENGYVDFDDKEFHGESWASVECLECNEVIECGWDKNNTRIVIEELKD